MGKITTHSSAEEIEDFILYHKYIASDENYGKEIKDFLVRAEDIVDSLTGKKKVPSDLINKLISLVGNEYNG